MLCIKREWRHANSQEGGLVTGYIGSLWAIQKDTMYHHVTEEHFLSTAMKNKTTYPLSCKKVGSRNLSSNLMMASDVVYSKLV